mmetsp:Transcript_36988/g.119734  ORF Transcript_36988/g.119734 Transcript_36988/m.119734 type:complete len:213 (-) Transcript_36988:83-721(-)
MGQAASPAPRRLRCRLRLRRRRRPCRRASAQRSGAGRLPPGSAPRARTRAGARRPRATATTRGASCERMGLAPRMRASGAGSTAPSLLPHRPQLRPRLRRCRPARACRCGTGSSTAAWTRGARSRRDARRSRALATRSAAACRQRRLASRTRADAAGSSARRLRRPPRRPSRRLSRASAARSGATRPTRGVPRRSAAARRRRATSLPRGAYR